MIRYYKSTGKNSKIKRLREYQKDCWIDVINPTSKEINFLVRNLKISRKNLYSGLDKNEVPRISQVDKDAYHFTKVISRGDNGLYTCLVLVTKEIILTLCKEETEFVGRIRKANINFATNQRLECAISIFSIIDKEFEDTTVEIVKLVQSKKRRVKELKEKDVDAVLAQEDVLNNLVSAYEYITLLYERMIKNDFYKGKKSLLNDLIIEAHQGLNLCQSSLKSIGNIRNAYNILLSNRLNKVITILTIFTIFISLPAAISGLYGMNLRLPLASNPYSFYYILILNFFIWVILLIYFKKKRIL